MKLKDKIRTKQTIRATSQKFGVSTEHCREEMQKAIDAGWENSRNDPAAKARWELLFPGGESLLSKNLLNAWRSNWRRNKEYPADKIDRVFCWINRWRLPLQQSRPQQHAPSEEPW